MLACPVVATCEHTFCGVCITSHLQSCTVEDEEDEEESYDIVHSCPMCRVEIEHTIFERTFHRDITDQIETLKSVSRGAPGFTESLHEWQERVSMYEKYMKEGERENTNKDVNKDRGEVDGENSDFLANCFYLAMAVAIVAAFALMRK